MNIIIFHGWGGANNTYVWSNSLAQICIKKDNILDLIYIKFVNTHFMGGQNILSPPPPHIFEWGGPIPPAPPVPTPLCIHMFPGLWYIE